MTVITAGKSAGAEVVIISSGWAGCTEEELCRRRRSFEQTAAEICGSRQSEQENVVNVENGGAADTGALA